MLRMYWDELIDYCRRLIERLRWDTKLNAMRNGRNGLEKKGLEKRE